MLDGIGGAICVYLGDLKCIGNSVNWSYLFISVDGGTLMVYAKDIFVRF